MGIKNWFSRKATQAGDLVTDIDRGLDRSGVNMHNWGHVKSIHSADQAHSDWGAVKTLGNVVASTGSTAFQTATKTGFGSMAYTAATGGTVALSATGIGAVAVAGTYAVGSSIAAGVSAYKTNQHINNLKFIHGNGPAHASCDGCRLQHDTIYNAVLPYIINKKQRKLRRKGEQIVPVLGGMATSLETGARSIYKRLRGTRSVERHWHAQVLTIHLISCHCGLADAIVSELWSPEEMERIRAMDSDEAGYYIFQKMASF